MDGLVIRQFPMLIFIARGSKEVYFEAWRENYLIEFPINVIYETILKVMKALLNFQEIWKCLSLLQFPFHKEQRTMREKNEEIM